jgi:DNA-3-methyladenine glycosylase II
LEGLLLTVTEQFLSLKAAAVIWQRIKAHLGEVTSAAVLRLTVADLMSLGLSGAKARSFLGIATAFADGSFDPAAIAKLPDELARKALLTLPGVGPWTADVYLLAALQRPNVWPWGDLALQVAAQDLFHLPDRPDKAAMLRLGEGFTPWRAVAARLLWSHYRGIKRIAQA